MDYKPKPGLSNDARLAVIEEIVGRMEQRLFGNGQEGEISKIKGRLTSIEQWRSKLGGGAAAMKVVWGIVGAALLLVLRALGSLVVKLLAGS